ncbi:pre-rRNA-processing protein ESF1 [Hyalella azteca]|uniref:Pre-rRNA-processing protein ESF1 n=1 Tax=Hyalella azteca TaxID=294128 RepID=A0A979FIH8_HYAAZ|nr:pre-rRNA-processing protein ESF1 [Hyalella azteca]
MVFDETPESSCSTIPATYTRTTADKFLSANYSKTKFDWDDDLDDRKKNLEKFADADQVKDDAALNEILAFESDDEDELEGNEDSDVMEFTSEFESVRSEDRSKRVELYRELMANLHTYDPVKEAERQLLQKALGDEAADAMDSKDDTHMEMEVEFSSDEESDEEKADKKSKSTDNLTPFEKYLKKRDDKQKQKKKAKKEAITGKKLIIDKEDEDIPDDLKNDPFFREELALRRKERLKLMKEHRDEQDAEMAQEELAKEEREKEMALLMLDDDGSVSRGVDMRELVQQAKQDAGGKKKLSRWKLSKLKIKEKRLAKQGVVLQRSSVFAADINQNT